MEGGRGEYPPKIVLTLRIVREGLSIFSPFSWILSDKIMVDKLMFFPNEDKQK